MRRTLMLSVFIAVFAMTGGMALANDNNDNRIGTPSPTNRPSTPRGGGVPCQGLYNAGVGFPPNPGGANPFGRTVGTPGYDHVFENDEEKCHNEPVPD